MFTGIVEEVGKIKNINNSGLSVYASKVLEGTILGDSIAVNGTCLTVVRMDDESFTVDLAPETIKRTGFGDMGESNVVNLERPVSADGRLGGHIVQGHVDGTGKITSIKGDADCFIISIRSPKKLMPYIVSKGFITIDGISLTVVKRNTASFTISVIPYTLEHTNLKSKQAGSLVNLEVDIVAKYVENLMTK